MGYPCGIGKERDCVVRIEWPRTIPEAMTLDVMKFEIGYIKKTNIDRDELMDRIREFTFWQYMYKKQDFPGRFKTNQAIFVETVLPILKKKLNAMGLLRPYVKR